MWAFGLLALELANCEQPQLTDADCMQGLEGSDKIRVKLPESLLQQQLQGLIKECLEPSTDDRSCVKSILRSDFIKGAEAEKDFWSEQFQQISFESITTNTTIETEASED